MQARVGRGDVTLTLQLRSPAFVAIGASESVEINVYADWEAVGIAALAALVGILLLFGIARTVIRVRRRRRGDDRAGDAGTGAHADAGATAVPPAEDVTATAPTQGERR